ncbi:aspartyl-phosphate phosphatase Spo0E family protein [Clostridium kluyveri]|uniref:Sporulation protein Spo0E n=1 Tax=Clostridium kluyveri TaxID=1534 RepID=A0A1L5FCA1_CLOKL|nr:aspartyl-phosphate phosphatase Spo0E family protein [Clostridium kluyveri]APM40634.1 sporulation protein Spo0E [Clostridium kluyveri]UZQ49244.1 aspartyl-phosphate phosphatase Spo0E family protein [Clostridium kluyveri]
MVKIEDILREIEALRVELVKAIENKKSLLDPDIVRESQKLDLILNEYNKMIEQKMQNVKD